MYKENKKHDPLSILGKLTLNSNNVYEGEIVVKRPLLYKMEVILRPSPSGDSDFLQYRLTPIKKEFFYDRLPSLSK